MNIFKDGVLAAIGVIGSWIAHMLGGWDSALTTLVIFMGLDYATGLIVAGVFKKSGKSENGALDSRAGWIGLIRKGMALAVVLVAARLDVFLELDMLRNTVIIAFIANETISIVENAGLMGVPVPDTISKAIDILKSKEKGE